MVASQIEFEEEILGSIQCLASFALPVLAVAFQQPDYLRTDMFQIFLTFLFAEDVEYIIKTNGKELHCIISDNMFENAIDLHMAAYKSAFQPYYHIIG